MGTLVPRLRVVLPDPTHYVHAHAFDEIAIALVAGLRRLGFDVDVTRLCKQDSARVLVLAPHLQSLDDLTSLDRDAILYTWEPMGWSHTVFITPELTSLMREFVVWDYSQNNVLTWRSLGAETVVHVPLAYDAALERLPARNAPGDVDVLFYGSVNERRKAVLDELRARGVKLQTLFGVYGRERDSWIARSRVVLNLHAHEGQILELPRLAYLWANKVPVVAEVNLGTEDSLGMAREMLTSPYEGLADRVVHTLANPDVATRSAENCYEAFRSGPSMSQVVRRGFVEAVSKAGAPVA